MPKRVAILDDDPDFSAMLQNVLEGAGYEAVSYGTVGRLLDAVLKKTPDMLVIDVNLPGVDGREVVRILRQNPSTRSMVVFVVSGEHITSPEVVKGFKEGADEYLPKPMDLEYFLIRANGLIKRSEELSRPAEPNLVECGNIRMNMDERTVSVGDKPVRLTRLEFELLHYFITHPGRVVTRALLLQEVWKVPMETTTRTVDRFVNHLRTKLKDFTGARIETLVDVGYMFTLDH